MHPLIYREFEDILRGRGAGGHVLEIGTLPTDDSLLCMPALADAEFKVGVNLDGPHRWRDFEIVKGNSNELEFEDASFDVVLSNATLEHDRYFWRTIAEIHRVTKPGGLIVIGVPGYVERRRTKRWQKRLRRWPLVRGLAKHPTLGVLFAGTSTFRVHNTPGDYWRFGEQAVEEVFLEGCRDVEVRCVLAPPRLIGVGVKP